jgi:thiol-disulfide isomerase/thioredoxin
MTLGFRLLVAGICGVIAGCQSNAETPSTSDAKPPKKQITGQEEVAPSAPATVPIDDKTAQSLVPAPPAATNPQPDPLPRGEGVEGGIPLPKDEGAKDVDPASIEVQAVSFSGFDDAVKSFQGKIVVADFWGTWCTVCKEKFPKFVDLAKSYEGRDEVVFLTVANELDAGMDEVKGYLAKSNPPTRNYLLEENPSEVPAKFGSQAGLPLYLVYSADGQVALRTNDVDAAIQKVHELLPLAK